MAAIIAGRDASVPVGGENDAKHFVGVAPDARILNMKVATADGGADVTQVIAAIDWVVQHRSDNGMNVRVINLSYGTRSTQSYQVDPLARAVENAWHKGIVVVIAAGNDGLGSTRLTMPAIDPYVIAVGAVDHRGTDTADDDRVTTFTNGGSSVHAPICLHPASPWFRCAFRAPTRTRGTRRVSSRVTPPAGSSGARVPHRRRRSSQVQLHCCCRHGRPCRPTSSSGSSRPRRRSCPGTRILRWVQVSST
jgi:hypothetical protein